MIVLYVSNIESQPSTHVHTHKTSCLTVSEFSVNIHLLLVHAFYHLLAFASRQVRGSAKGLRKLYRKKIKLGKFYPFS